MKTIKYSTTQLFYKIVDKEYLGPNGKIKDRYKWNINNTEFGIVDSQIPAKADEKFNTYLFLPEGEDRQGEGGLRTRGYFKKSFEDKPLISIITVVFNGERFLEETILSVINQSYDNVEYIIIDGGSSDRTLEIIKKYEDRIDYWVSERDRGIYDAMNKGILLANQNSYLMWINAGDKLNDLNNFLKVYQNKFDAYFFSVLQQQDNGELKEWKIKKVNQIDEKNIIFPGIHHQGFMIAKKCIKYFYDLNVGELSDLLFMSKVINKKTISKLFVPTIFSSTYTLGGLSDKSGFKRLKSYINISKALKLNFTSIIIFNSFKIFKLILKSLLPYYIIRKIRNVLNRLS